MAHCLICNSGLDDYETDICNACRDEKETEPCEDCGNHFPKNELIPYKYERSVKLCDDCNAMRMEEDED